MSEITPEVSNPTKKSPTPRKAKLYKIEAGSLLEPKELLLVFIEEFSSAAQASKYLHSQECFLKHLKEAGVEQAEFLIIADSQHFVIRPITLYVSQSLQEQVDDKTKHFGKILV